jgi:uncharacterized protein (DUF1810 family)
MNELTKTDRSDPSRFVDAQGLVDKAVLRQLEQGSKRTHWMWYVFP